jgi:hypothetical protein
MNNDEFTTLLNDIDNLDLPEVGNLNWEELLTYVDVVAQSDYDGTWLFIQYCL